MNHTEFDISRFANRNGVTSWRVSGWLHGVRIRRNFKTREEAAAEKSVLEIKALQASAGMRAAMTSLDDAQLRQAEAVFLRLAGLNRPLPFYVDLALSHHREPEQEKKLGEAIAEYVGTKEHEHEQDLLSPTYLKRIRRDLKRLQKAFPGATVAELSGPRLVAFFEMGRPSLKTFNNRRGIVSTFLKYALVKGWVAENPLTRIPARRIRRRRCSAVTLTAERVREMMAFLETFEGGRWVPFFAVALFAGVRPAVPDGEITRLQPDAFDLEAGVISISAQVSKVREPRRIVIQPNLVAWLRAYPLKEFRLVLPDFQRRHAALAKQLGLSHDVLRHTFISMFVAKYRSLGEAALQAGNSETIIRKHYLDLKSEDEAARFFGIIPQHRPLPAVVTLPETATVLALTG